MKKKILITGASGLLGYNACQFFCNQGYHVVGVSLNHDIDLDCISEIKVDLLDPTSTQSMFEKHRPDIVLHTAAITNVDLCESDPDTAYKHHVTLSENIAIECKRHHAKLIFISTDQLWDGTKSFMTENDSVSPLNMYGLTKALAEKKLLEICPDALIIRTNFFGKGRPWRLSFTDWIKLELLAHKTINGFCDIYYTPIAIDDLLVLIEKLYNKGALSIYHVAGSQRVSKYDFMMIYSEIFNLKSELIQKTRSCLNKDMQAIRPLDMSLDVKKVENALGIDMPNVEQGIRKIIENDGKQRKV